MKPSSTVAQAATLQARLEDADDDPGTGAARRFAACYLDHIGRVADSRS